MGSADVRAAVVAFFEGAAIPGLNKIHPAPPYWADGAEWDLGRNFGSGAIGALHLVADNERRITVPVLTGQKLVHYRVGLMIFYQWLKPQSLSPVDPSAWADPLDVIIDGVKARLRSDPNCGMPSEVWQAGQDDGDLSIQRDLPRQVSGGVVSWNVLEFTVYEVVTA